MATNSSIQMYDIRVCVCERNLKSYRFSSFKRIYKAVNRKFKSLK
jgi:hypothetical protein